MNFRKIALFIGPLLFLSAFLVPELEGLSKTAILTGGIVLWMAVWWITEPIHITATALLPLVLFPVCGVLTLKQVSQEYGNEIIFLFIGGFLFGVCIERWNLHKRIALNMVMQMGTEPKKIVLGFMLSTGFISMWISNTATAVMMTPVAIAVAVATPNTSEKGDHKFAKALLLGVGYACSIGGLGTLIGTPTNAIFATYMQQKLNVNIAFGQWFWFGFPFAMLLLLVCWQILIRIFKVHENGAENIDNQAYIKSELISLGHITTTEKRLAAVFGVVILSWISGSLIWYKWWPQFNDTIVILAGAICLFIIPSGNPLTPNQKLLEWDVAKKLPWHIVLLFGGGLALAKGFDQSGLAFWIGKQLHGLASWPHIVVMGVVLLLVVVLSEIASNIATASMMMPTLAALSVSIGMDTSSLLLGATFAASLGFALPIANAANSIVFSSGLLEARDLYRAGFLLDLVAVVLLLIFMQFVFPLVW